MKSHDDKADAGQRAGVDFEGEVYEQVKRTIAQHRLMLAPKSCYVNRKKSYYSKAREKDIVFDVVIEAFCNSASTPSLIWIWECKDYPTRKVSVDEIEEFYSKLMQVGFGSVKGTMVTRVGFDAGAEKYAKSQRIGLAVLQEELIAVTHYERGAPEYERIILTSPSGVLLSGKEYSERDRLFLDHIIRIELRSLGVIA